VDLVKALALLGLPRTVGRHPESGEPITAGIGRFGPYIKHGAAYKSLGREDDVLTIGINRAVALIAEAGSGKPARQGRRLGNHPGDGKPVTTGSGRYGPYVRHGRTFASIPKDTDPDGVTLDQAVELLRVQSEKAGARDKAKPRGRGRAGAAAA